MSLDKSLKSGAALTRHRNVLTRAERIEALREEARWTDDMEPFGLPKVAHRKASVGGKTKKAKVAEGEGDAATESTESATPAAEKQ